MSSDMSSSMWLHPHTHFSVLYSMEESTVETDPIYITCTKNSPVGEPVWSPGPFQPPVRMSHIFCGEIDDYSAARGFHSRSSETNWGACVYIDERTCMTFLNGNEHCRDVYISNTHKEQGSTLWPSSLAPNTLVPMLQYLYNTCPQQILNADLRILCFHECHYAGNDNAFDIVIIGTDAGIMTAYPAQEGTCLRHHEYEICGKHHCQEL